jgi:hypothetical protein
VGFSLFRCKGNQYLRGRKTECPTLIFYTNSTAGQSRNKIFKKMKKKSLLLTVVATIGLTTTTMAQVPNYVPTNGLVGWWPFNGNANDESGNGNNGAVNGALLTQDRNGSTNSAFSFDGISNNITVPHSNSLDLNIPLSISAWIKVDAYPNDGNEHYFISKFSGGPGNAMQGFHAAFSDWNNGDYLFWRYRNNTTSNWGGVSSSYTDFPNEGNWFQIVLTTDGVNDKFYVNGNLINSAPSSILGLNSADLLFGQDQNYSSASRNFAGNLDDIGIWNRTLTEQEITDLFNSINCSNNLTITPQNNALNTGNNASLSATTSDANPNYIWQSDFGQGFQTLNNYGSYSGANTATLNISSVQLRNHNQPIRAISTSGNCIDTSNVATISISDTCINLITVTDTLIINTTLGVQPNLTTNTIKVFPNPANTHITIDYGNFSSMSGYSIKIINALSQEVFSSAINQQTSFIDLSTWSGDGIYFVQILDSQSNVIENRKIVLQ